MEDKFHPPLFFGDAAEKFHILNSDGRLAGKSGHQTQLIFAKGVLPRTAQTDYPQAPIFINEGSVHEGFAPFGEALYPRIGFDVAHQQRPLGLDHGPRRDGLRLYLCDLPFRQAARCHHVKGFPRPVVEIEDRKREVQDPFQLRDSLGKEGARVKNGA